MKLSALLISVFGTADVRDDGRVNITPSMLPTAEPRCCGVRVAERIARLVGTVHLTSFSFHPAPIGVGRMQSSSNTGHAIAQFLSGAWRVSGDTTWRKYGPSTTIVFGGNADVSVYCDDIEIVADVSAEIAADAHERAMRVVWRARPSQFVVRCIFDGRFVRTVVLTPDGTERVCFAPSSYDVISKIVGGRDSDDFHRRLREDPVWGRSECRYQRGETFASFTRVVGFGAYRRILAASRADFVELTSRPGFSAMLTGVRAIDPMTIEGRDARRDIITRWLIDSKIPHNGSPFGTSMQNAMWSAAYEFGTRIDALADGTALM